MSLSRQQQEALQIALTSRENWVFTGEAGTGKTLLIRHIADQLRTGPYKRPFHVCAMTGNAATAIGGTTLHHFLGLGLFRGDPYSLAAKINRYPMPKKRWQKVATIILDEFGTLDPYLFRRINKVAQIVRESTELFGGIQFLLFGDPAQCPPIYTDDNPQEGPFVYAFEDTELFPPLSNVFLLTEIFRQKDPVFQGMLSRIRLANETKEDYKILRSRMHAPPVDDNIRPVDLHARKTDVQAINLAELEKLQPDRSKWEIYKATQTVRVKTPEKKRIAENLILAFRKNRSAPEELQLAVNAQVLLTKNLDVSEGLCNGASGVVEAFEQDPKETKGRFYPLVRFASGIKQLIRPVESDIEYQGEVYAVDVQVPLLLAWAITIHKAQGMSLTRVSIALDEHVRQPGQGYAALSRVTTLEGLHLKSFSPEALGADAMVVEWFEKLQALHEAKEQKRLADEKDERDLEDLLILEVDKVVNEQKEKGKRKRSRENKSDELDKSSDMLKRKKEKFKHAQTDQNPTDTAT